MFDSFAKLGCACVVVMGISVFLIASVEALIPVAVLGGVIYVIYHVAKGLSKGG